MNFFVSGKAGGVSWTRQEIDGNPCYTLPSSAAVWVAPAIVMTDKFLVCGLNLESAKVAVRRLKANDARLDTTAGYRKAAATVVQPASVFGFIDGKASFEKIYDTLKPLVMMSAAFLPKVKDYVDLGKLPPVEAISKHLGPIVFSQGSTDEGLLFESTGVITFSQAIFGVGAGFVAAAVPAMKSQLLDTKALQSGQSPFSVPTLPMPASTPPQDATNLPTPEPSPAAP